MVRSNHESRTQNANNINDIHNEIQHERIPRSVLDRIEGNVHFPMSLVTGTTNSNENVAMKILDH